jgi:hypothetical protein
MILSRNPSGFKTSVSLHIIDPLYERGSGYACPEPTIRFHGKRAEGFRVLSIALQYSLSVSRLKRVWCNINGKNVDPTWELTFSVKN